MAAGRASMARANKDMRDEDWIALRRDIVGAFTPGTPIDETDLFAGRQEAIGQLQDAVLERGKHAIIYGERGVGKTSIANIFHRPLNSTTRTVLPIRVNADTNDTFASLWLKVFRRIKRGDNGSAWWADEAHKGQVTPDDVQVELGSFNPNEMPIIIIDEFDRIEDDRCKILMTDALKVMSDFGVNATVILVGVAESVPNLISGHESISRALAQVPMPRMSQPELAVIVSTRTRHMGMNIEDDALWRITFFSSGLPFYTHSLGKHAALRAVEAKRRKIMEKDVYNAIKDCLMDVDHTVKESYVKATERIYRKPNIYAEVLAACALAVPDTLGKYSATSIEAPLSEITGEQYKSESFGFHLNQLCSPDRGKILKKTGSRRSIRFQFIDPLMRPYVIMQSIQDQIISQAVVDKFSLNRQQELSI